MKMKNLVSKENRELRFFLFNRDTNIFKTSYKIKPQTGNVESYYKMVI